MLKSAWVIMAKDLRMLLLRGGAWMQAFLLGLLLIFVFSLSLPPGEHVSGQTAATIFWLASAFCQVLAFNMLYALEEPTQARTGLSLLSVPLQAVWLGKLGAGLALIVLAQCVFFPALLIFLGQQVNAIWPYALLSVVLIDVGLAGLGSFLGALSSGQSARESLLSVIIFPLMIPLLLAGIQAGAAVFAMQNPEVVALLRWLGLAVAYDAVFLGLAMALFPFVFGDAT